jgi:DNA-3-methyladenine glycosylase
MEDTSRSAGGFDLDGEVTAAARSLLGATLRRGEVAVRITEVEAYDGAVDPASHAYNGKTQRNYVMFGPAGRLYVYLNYGMHHAANVSAGAEGHGCGVLLRSGEVISGLEVARERRGAGVSDRDLARGPGRLTQALAITRPDNGTRLLDDPDSPITLAPPVGPVTKINTGPRVGVTKEADRPWRFWIAGDAYVSDYRRATVRSRSARSSGSE